MEKFFRIGAVIFIALLIFNFTACNEDGGETPKPVKYTVTFDKNHNDATEAVPRVRTASSPNYLVALPNIEPTLADHQFGGWFLEDGCINTFDTSVKITKNMTVYAKWIPDGQQVTCTVSFDQGHDDIAWNDENPRIIIKTVSYTAGEGAYGVVDPLPVPAERGGNWNFLGWYTVLPDLSNEVPGVPFTIETHVIQNMTVKAYWDRPVEITVSFNQNHDEIVWDTDNPRVIEVKATLIAPAAFVTVTLPSINAPAEGWNFTGWNTKDNGSGDAFDQFTHVTEDITVYAQWVQLAAGKALVNFNKGHADNGTEADPHYIEIDKGTAIGQDNMPKPPTRAGHDFAGWRDAGGGPFTHETIVYDTITVYANWDVHEYTITFDKNDGDTDAIPPSLKVNYLQNTLIKAGLSLPIPPAYAYYIFGGWFDIDGESFDEYTEVNDDITVYAKWTVMPLGGTAGITGTYRIGATLTVNTSAITTVPPVTTTYIYHWQADGEDIHGANESTYVIDGSDAGKTITCVVTHGVMNGAITAAGQKVPFDIHLDIEQAGREASDNVTLSAAFGLAGANINLNYTLANTHNNNRLEIFGVTINKNSPEDNFVFINGPGGDAAGTKIYNVDADDAHDGVITIGIVFFHTNLIMETLLFEDHEDIAKTYGDVPFSNPLTNEGKGNPLNTNPIVYSSDNAEVAAVNSAGLVTINKAGSTVIRAVKAADGVYSGDAAHYNLFVNPKHITITGGLTVQAKKFDNTKTAVILGTAVFANVINGDTVSFTPENAEFVDKNAGTGIEVTYSGELTGADAANYTIADNGWLNLSGDITHADGYTLQSVPTAYAVTPNGITINAIAPPDPAYLGQDGLVVEYNYGTTAGAQTGTWQTGLSFTGLSMGTDYYIFARLSGNSNVNAGTPVVSAVIKTQTVAVKLNKAATTLYVSTTANTPAGRVVETLTATVEIDGVVDPGHAITWTSGTPGTATISDGVITAIGRASGSGTSTITASSTVYNSATATCAVTVTFVAAPTTITANLPIIDNLDNGWYAPLNNVDGVIRQTSPFPHAAIATSSSTTVPYCAFTYSAGGANPAPSISARTFDTADKAEGESSIRMTFALGSVASTTERNATIGINFSPIPFADVNRYNFLAFQTKASYYGWYVVTIQTTAGNHRLYFISDTVWEQEVIALPKLTGNITRIEFQANNLTGFANAATTNRSGSLWIDDIKLAGEIDTVNGYYEDRGYMVRSATPTADQMLNDGPGSGYQGHYIYATRGGWTRYRVALNSGVIARIENSGTAANGTNHPFDGTERFDDINADPETSERYITAAGIDAAGMNPLDVDLNDDDTWMWDLGYVEFDVGTITAAGNHQVHIVTTGERLLDWGVNRMLLVKLNDNPAKVVSLPPYNLGAASYWGGLTMSVKQIVVGPFKGDGSDKLIVSGAVGGSWFNLFHVDVRNAAE